LNVVLATAVDEGVLASNPVPLFKKRLKLKAPRRGKAGFEDGELARMWAAFESQMAKRAKPWKPVYRYAAEFSAETGLRLGELVALDLDSLRGSDLHVTHTYDDVDGLIPPKDGEARIVYLTTGALAVLAKWLPIRGDASGPLFSGPTGGRLNKRELQRKLEQARDAAGIPKVHPEIGLKRSFHSLRYSTSNLMQRRGHHVRFIEQTLGHSTLDLSLNLYGGWSPDQMRAEAARVGQSD